MKKNNRFMKVWGILTVCSMLAVGRAAAQNDFGMWYEVGVEKKLSTSWSVAGEAEFRTRNNTKTADRWAAGLSAEFRIVKGLKVDAGYNLLYDNNPEKLTWKKELPNKWTPSYWALRHRLHLSVTGSLELSRLKFSLRERWQYTMRPEVKDKKYNFAWSEDANENDYISGYELEPVKSKCKHMFRHRLGIDYNIPHCKFDPFVNAEMFTDCNGIQKMRYQAGIDYKLTKQHQFSLTYRYQHVSSSDDDDNDINSHLVGLSYKYKF